MKTAHRIAALSFVLAAGCGSALGADSYTSTTIQPIPGGTGTIGYGVNDAGMVVGQADNEFGEIVAFVWENGVTTALPNLAGGFDGLASGVNSSGVIVGSCRNASNVSRAVKWERDAGNQWVITDLGTLDAGNAGFGVASRINDAGQIVGYASISPTGAYHACIWSGTEKLDLGTLDFGGNFAYSQGLGIAENGDACGYAYAVLQGPEHGLYYTGGRGQDITPPEQFGLAQWHAVTNSGVLAGYISANSTQGSFRPAIYENRSFNVIPLIPGMTDGYGYDMNESGVFVGEMFLPQPAPDPSIFKAFIHENGATSDLSEITVGAPGLITSARDVSPSGLIVGTADTGAGALAVLLTPVVTPRCPADFNRDTVVSVQDIFDYLAAYFSNGEGADFNGDRAVTVQDIFDFLAAYFTGCN